MSTRTQFRLGFWLTLPFALAGFVALFFALTPSVSAPEDAQTVRPGTVFMPAGCYEGASPTGAIPSKAVVTYPGGRPRLVGFEAGWAVVTGERAGTPHGFCD